jgi:hypothetical protein
MVYFIFLCLLVFLNIHPHTHASCISSKIVTSEDQTYTLGYQAGKGHRGLNGCWSKQTTGVVDSTSIIRMKQTRISILTEPTRCDRRPVLGGPHACLVR